MQITEITITERASVGYQVSEYSYTIALQPEEDPTEAINYIRNLAITNATSDVKALANNFPSNNNSVGNTNQQPRQGYTAAPKQQYQRAPYHQNGQRSQYKAQPKEPSEAQVAYYTQLAQQVGNTAPCPSTSYECAQAIQMMKNDLGIN